MDDVKLWKSNEKSQFELFLFGLFAAYGYWTLINDYNWFGVCYTIVVGLIFVLKLRSHFLLTNMEKAVNNSLLERGYTKPLTDVTTVNESGQFVGFVRELKLYSKNGETGKYVVGLSKVDNITFYHFTFLGNSTKWVAVVDGKNIQYFKN